MKKICQLIPVLTASAFFFTPLAMANDDSLLKRAAIGNIQEFGGAKRLSEDQSQWLKEAITTGKVKNVILLIGDGMGDSEITAARNYVKGASGYFAGLDALPFTGSYTHYSLDKKTKQPDYVTDSAASATAWTTGVKTYNGALGVDVNEQPHMTLLELAKKAGKATGNISTAEIQDATPAALYSHVNHRKCYGPDATSKLCPTMAIENGGLGSITEQLLTTRADVTLGGGAYTFNESAKAGKWQGKTLEQQAKDLGYVIVTNNQQLMDITKADQQKPLLGLFADKNMPVRWQGPKATYKGSDGEAIKCEVNKARNDSVPTLAEMTQKGIELLDVNNNGFFLQVEGASIDKQAHEANPCAQFGETVDLDEAVQVALKFAEKNGDTLVIVTGDHAHATQIIPHDAQAYGLTLKMITADNSPMTVSYATSDTESQNHTGTQIRIAAYGPNAANVSGLLDQTDLFFIIRDAMGIK
ncbi:alkaline phosphatase [Orbus mooreae]|uniref:alkaline phosphatase n=1 Tax=Orbus mooreae TaxID=3074107 RepID=UPI00370D52BB